MIKRERQFRIPGLLLAILASLPSLQFARAAEDAVASETLSKELSIVFEDMVKQDDKILGELDVTLEQFKEKMLAGWKKSILVTKEEEEKFKRGEFSDESNALKMKVFTTTFKDTRNKIPDVAQFFLSAYEKGELKGVRLEAAVRLLHFVLDHRKALEKR